MMKDKLSVIVVARNEEKYIQKCILSILNQTYQNFELIIVDDCSTDRTPQIIQEFDDERIRYFRNSSNLGIAKSRNIAIEKVRCKYVFFTDGDCMPMRSWLKDGLNWFENNDSILIQGRVYYEISSPSVSDRIKSNESGKFMTANMAMLKSTLDKLNGFDAQFNYAYEDVDLALRAKNIGKVDFCENMIVIHRNLKYTFKRYLEDYSRVKELMLLIKKHGKTAEHYIKHYLPRKTLKGFVLYPYHLIIIFFPMLILLYENFRNLKEFKHFFFMYIAMFKLRFTIWKTALKEKMFFI